MLEHSREVLRDAARSKGTFKLKCAAADLAKCEHAADGRACDDCDGALRIVQGELLSRGEE